jgi:hypothetical protein
VGKYISPNLIHQVLPNGGGDGKTDSVTHSVSESISFKWYTHKNGCDNNEKWAFAISVRKIREGNLDIYKDCFIY